MIGTEFEIVSTDRNKCVAIDTGVLVLEIFDYQTEDCNVSTSS